MAIGATAGVAGSAQAAFPGANGKIAFTEQPSDTSNQDVFTINPDGTGLTNVTNTSAEAERFPDWSPDGTRIAFFRGVGAGNEGLWVMNADGSAQTQLSAELIQGGLTWSPDGSKIAYFVPVPSSPQFAMRVVNSDGSGTPTDTPLPSDLRSPVFPEWSPDGTRLAFSATVASTSATEALTINLDGTGLVNVSNSASVSNAPDWSPDSTRLIWNESGVGLVTAPADGTGTPLGVPGAVQSGQGVFSPDGGEIAFVQFDATFGGLRLKVANQDGSSPSFIHDSPSGFGEIDWQPLAEPAEVLSPVVSKTASTYVSRERDWNIRKYADPEVGWDAKTGSVAVDYTVKVGTWLGPKTDPVASGVITVRNPNTEASIVVDGVTDVLPGASCELFGTTTDLAILPGGERTISYACQFGSVPNGVLTNTATVSWHASGIEGTYAPVAATAPVDFSSAEVEVNGIRSMTVTDTLWGDKTRVLAEDLGRSKTFTYTRYLRAANKCRVFSNTARLIPNGPIREAGLAPLPEFDPDAGVFAKMMASVTVCPPPAKPGAGGDPVVVVDNPGTKPTKAEVTPTKTPKGEVVVKDPKSAVGRLRVFKRASNKRARIGGNVVWTIKVRNTGKADLSDVVLTDVLPRHLRPVRVMAGKNARSARRRNVLRVRIGDLLVGQTHTLRVVTRVVGKPRMDVASQQSIAKAKGRTRVVLRNRVRKGIVCNIAIARASNARTVKGIGCTRVMAPAPEVPTENPAEGM
ncbi:MAG: hypothetical protein R2878_11570 [Thermoleophilia bacterium]